MTLHLIVQHRHFDVEPKESTSASGRASPTLEQFQRRYGLMDEKMDGWMDEGTDGWVK